MSEREEIVWEPWRAAWIRVERSASLEMRGGDDGDGDDDDGWDDDAEAWTGVVV